MLRTVGFLIGVPGYLIVVWPVLLFTRITGTPARESDRVARLVQHWARFTVRLAGGRVTVLGQENLPAGGAMMMSNHQGYFDIPVLLGYCGRVFGFVAKESVHRIPVLGGWMAAIGCVNIRRQEPALAMRQLMEQSAQELQGGNMLCIFPEGTRSKGQPLLPFKRGGFRSAIAAGVPIVPVAVEGSHRMYELRRGPTVGPAGVTIRILPPVDPSGYDEENMEELIERVREPIRLALEELTEARQVG